MKRTKSSVINGAAIEFKEKFRKNLQKTMEEKYKKVNDKITCPYCKSNSYIINFEGGIEINESPKMKIAIRKLRIPLNPVITCSKCFKRFTAPPDELVDLESKIQDYTGLYYDGTGPSLHRRNIKN